MLNPLNIITLEGFRMEEIFNKHLGNKLRMRRQALGLTQTKVAKAINVTFQQIQKYEKGTNGVSSTRLLQIANFLNVPVVYFFEDFKDYNPKDKESISSDENLNYSFILKLFQNFSDTQKEKLLQVLKNTRNLEKTG